MLMEWVRFKLVCNEKLRKRVEGLLSDHGVGSYVSIINKVKHDEYETVRISYECTVELGEFKKMRDEIKKMNMNVSIYYGLY